MEKWSYSSTDSESRNYIEVGSQVVSCTHRLTVSFGQRTKWALDPVCSLWEKETSLKDIRLKIMQQY